MEDQNKKASKLISKKDIAALTEKFKEMPPNADGSSDELSLAEIFSNEEDQIIASFVEEIESMINTKGYGFNEIAKIMSEHTGKTFTGQYVRFQYRRTKTMTSNQVGDKKSKKKYTRKQKPEEETLEILSQKHDNDSQETKKEIEAFSENNSVDKRERNTNQDDVNTGKKKPKQESKQNTSAVIEIPDSEEI